MKNIFVILILLASRLSLFACTCVGGQKNIHDEVKESDVVTVGQILSKEEFYIVDGLTGITIEMVRYLVYPKNTYKGQNVIEPFEVVTGSGNGDCGFQFEVGLKYIIYADYKNKYYAKGEYVDEFLSTDICKRTKLLDMNEVRALEEKYKIANHAQHFSNCDYMELALENTKLIDFIDLQGEYEGAVEFLDTNDRFKNCIPSLSNKKYDLIQSVSEIKTVYYVTVFYRELTIDNEIQTELSFFRNITNDLFFVYMKEENGELSIVKTRSGTF